MALVDKVVDVHELLERAGIAHAFGGAIALGYHARPRGTVEIDLNVFAPPSEQGRVVDRLSELGVGAPTDAGPLIPTAGVMCPWDETHIDIFFSYDEAFFDSVQRRVEEHVFFSSDEAEHILPFLSAEDLVIFKLTIDGEKDWVDIRHVLEERPLDSSYVERWLLYLKGERAWPRLRRFEALVTEVRG